MYDFGATHNRSNSDTVCSLCVTQLPFLTDLALESLEAIRNGGAEPAELAQFLWCIAVLGASNPTVQQAVARHAGTRVDPAALFTVGVTVMVVL